MLTVIIPSFNEENYIAACLEALLTQAGLPDNHSVQVIVAANGCHDATVSIAQRYAPEFARAGFDYLTLNIAQPGKTNALNVADGHAEFANRAYLDADVVLGPGFLAELLLALRSETDPVYIGGSVEVPRSRSWVTRAYARIWTNLPFVREGVPGIGFYAFNAAGRARWSEFPEIIGDDRYVRLQFRDSERKRLKATYKWPLPEGFFNMVKAKRRWSEGNLEVSRKFPELAANDSQRNTSADGKLLLLRHPISGLIFVAITLGSKGLAVLQGTRRSQEWRRGRT